MQRQETETYDLSSVSSTEQKHNTTPQRKPGRPRIYSSVEEANKVNRIRSNKNFHLHQLAQSEKYKALIDGFSHEKLVYQREFLKMKLELIEKRLARDSNIQQLL